MEVAGHRMMMKVGLIGQDIYPSQPNFVLGFAIGVRCMMSDAWLILLVYAEVSLTVFNGPSFQVSMQT